MGDLYGEGSIGTARNFVHYQQLPGLIEIPATACVVSDFALHGKVFTRFLQCTVALV